MSNFKVDLDRYATATRIGADRESKADFLAGLDPKEVLTFFRLLLQREEAEATQSAPQSADADEDASLPD